MVRFLISAALVLVAAPVMAEGEPWIDDPAKAMEIARSTGRPVLMHFWNEQCLPCRRVETFVFTNGQVIESLSRNFVSVKVNTTQHPDLVRRYRVERIPQDVVVLPNGQVVSQVQSPLNSRSYLAMLDQVAADAGKPNAGSDLALARALAYNETSNPADSVPVSSPQGSSARPHASIPTSEVPTATHRRFSDSSSSSPVPQDNAGVVNGQGSGVVQAAPAAPLNRPVSSPVSVPTATVQGSSPAANANSNATVQVANPYVNRQVSGTDEPAPVSQAAGAAPATSSAQGAPTRTVNGGGAFRPPGAPVANPQVNPPIIPRSNPALPPTPVPSQAAGANPVVGNPAIGNPAGVNPAGVNPASPSLPGTQAPSGTQPPRVAATPQWPQSAPNPARPPMIPQGFAPQGAAPAAPVIPQAAENPVAESPVEPQGEPQLQGPPLGLQGFCPVALVRDRVWQEGNQAYGCIHRGKLYLFCCPGHRDEFLRTPDEFAPVLSGFDPVIFAEENRLVEGKREHGAFVDDRIILFANEETFQKFTKDSLPYIRAVQQAMAASDSVRR